MAAVTICSDFGAQENKICHCYHFFPSSVALYLHSFSILIKNVSRHGQMSLVGEKKLKFENCYCKYFEYAHVSYSLQNILKYKFSVFKVSKTDTSGFCNQRNGLYRIIYNSYRLLLFF